MASASFQDAAETEDEKEAGVKLSARETWIEHIAIRFAHSDVRRNTRTARVAVAAAKVAKKFAAWRRRKYAGTLDLSRCDLKSLPYDYLLDIASRIEILDVSENFITELSDDLFSFCISLHTLRCSNNQMLSLSARIGACKMLQAVYCDNNYIASLPERLGECTALQVLDVKNNRLSSLPSTLGKCTKLEVLDCSENQVSELPVHLCLLLRLIVLECHSNPFRVGTPASWEAIRAEAQSKVVRAALMFCYEATQQDRARGGGGSGSAHVDIGDIALDNMREIARFITVPPHLLFCPQEEKSAGAGLCWWRDGSDYV